MVVPACLPAVGGPTAIPEPLLVFGAKLRPCLGSSLSPQRRNESAGVPSVPPIKAMGAQLSMADPASSVSKAKEFTS